MAMEVMPTDAIKQQDIGRSETDYVHLPCSEGEVRVNEDETAVASESVRDQRSH